MTDEPQYIDYPHLEAVTRLVNAVVVRLAGLDRRIQVDDPRPSVARAG